MYAHIFTCCVCSHLYLLVLTLLYNTESVITHNYYIHIRTRTHTLQTLLTVWVCGSWMALSGTASCSPLCWPSPTSRTRLWWLLWTCRSRGPSWSRWSAGLRSFGSTSRPYRYQTSSSKLCRRTVSGLYLGGVPHSIRTMPAVNNNILWCLCGHCALTVSETGTNSY